MNIQDWSLYLLLVLAATSTPGPAVLFIMSNSALYGWQKALFIALGNIIGLLVLGIISITGLGIMLQTSELLFGIIKYIGAAYLVYMGIKMIRNKSTRLKDLHNHATSSNISSKKLLIQAFAVAASNPKAILFLTALFPQFIDRHTAMVPQFAILIFILMFFSFSFLMTYAILASRAKVWLSKPKRVRWMNKISGSIFIGFGALLATSSNKS